MTILNGSGAFYLTLAGVVVFLAIVFIAGFSLGKSKKRHP